MKGLKRFGVISRVLLRHGFGDVAERLFITGDGRPKPHHDDDLLFKSGFPSPRRIRLVLEELGPSFIKLGQLMSIRADIFPPEYLNEFKKLQDSVPPVPFPAIKKSIEEDLRCPLEEVFAEFSPESLAAASVAQVHLARLFNGQDVAVKIVRPGIRKKIRQDIGLMYALARRIEKSFELGRSLGAVNLVKEFERTIYRELDMFVEAGSIEKFAHNFQDLDEIYIPKVYWDYTTKSMLIMERIEGIKMDQVDAIRDHGIDPREVALIGLRSFSRQLMEFGFFHGDPHPGNTIVMYDGRVSLVDFGITGYLDEEMMRHIAHLFLGYAEHDYDMVLEALWNAGLIEEETMDLPSFRVDLKDISEAFYGRSLQTISVRDVYDQVMQLVLKYHLTLPRNLLLLLKTFIQTEALGKILGSDASILEVTKPYAKKLLQRGYEAQKVFKNVGKDFRSMGSYLKMTPKLIHDLLRQTVRGQQRVELRHNGFQELGSQFERSINRFTVGMILSASIIAAALILNSTQKVLEFSFRFFGLQKISLTEVLGLIGYVIATILGIWLIVSILRSRKL